MMNNVCIIGRLTRDVACKEFDNGKKVFNFSLATSKNYRNTTSGEFDTVFVDVQAWNSVGDGVSKYLKKGTMVAVTGALDNKKNTVRDTGTEYTTTIIVASRIDLCGGKREDNGEGTGAPKTTPSSKASATPVETIDDDDFPF